MSLGKRNPTAAPNSIATGKLASWPDVRPRRQFAGCNGIGSRRGIAFAQRHPDLGRGSGRRGQGPGFRPALSFLEDYNMKAGVYFCACGGVISEKINSDTVAAEVGKIPQV